MVVGLKLPDDIKDDWDSLGGLVSAKKELKSMFYLENETDIRHGYSKLKEPCRSALFYGPPGLYSLNQHTPRSLPLYIHSYLLVYL